jgi:hypothetical protein
MNFLEDELNYFFIYCSICICELTSRSKTIFVQSFFLWGNPFRIIEHFSPMFFKKYFELIMFAMNELVQWYISWLAKETLLHRDMHCIHRACSDMHCIHSACVGISEVLIRLCIFIEHFLRVTCCTLQNIVNICVMWDHIDNTKNWTKKLPVLYFDERQNFLFSWYYSTRLKCVKLSS